MPGATRAARITRITRITRTMVWNAGKITASRTNARERSQALSTGQIRIYRIQLTRPAAPGFQYQPVETIAFKSGRMSPIAM